MGESQVIFLLLSLFPNPQFSPFLIPSQSVYLSLTRRVVSSLYISRSVAAASIILRRLVLSLKKAQVMGDSDSTIDSILWSDPLFQKISLRRIADVLQLEQKNLLHSIQPSASLFPSFFPWYMSHSHGALLDLVTAVSLTSSEDSVAAHIRLRLRDFLYSLCMENCRILRQLRDFSLGRQSSILSLVTLIRNSLLFRSGWMNLPDELKQKQEISEFEVDAIHLEVLLGCVLVAWEMWDVSLLQLAMKAMHNFDLGVWEIAEILEKQKLETSYFVLADETPSIVEMSTLIAINLLRSSIIDSILTLLKQQMSRSAAYLDESIGRRWKDQISYLEQWKKNLLGLMVSFGPGELAKEREHLPLYFSRFLQGAKAAFSPPSLQTLWEQEGGKQALKAFVDRLNESSCAFSSGYEIQYSHNEIVWKWNGSSCTVQRQSSRALRISINGNPLDCCFVRPDCVTRRLLPPQHLRISSRHRLLRSPNRSEEVRRRDLPLHGAPRLSCRLAPASSSLSRCRSPSQQSADDGTLRPRVVSRTSAISPARKRRAD